ncbi:MAG TPA: hypothetical protein PLB92_00390 [Rhodoglobus sp.]|nr:hypothetical protein [Rhodoglobus sp.]
MTTFPTPYTVIHKVFNGTGEDDLGNDAETWSDGVEVSVIAIQSGMVENVNGHTSRVVADVDMAVPPDLRVTVRDRFTLPYPFNDPDDVNDKPYEVVALEDGLGFHGWRPGYVVKLRKVTG